MLNNISLIIGFVLSCSYIMISFTKFFGLPHRNKLVISSVFILFIILNCCNFFFIDKSLSTFTIFLVVTIINFILYHKTLLETIMSSFLLILIGFSSDAIFGFILLILAEFGLIKSNILLYSGSIFPNIVIPMISLTIVVFLPINTLYQYFLYKFKKITDAQILFLLGSLIASINLLSISVFRDINKISLFCLNSTLMLFYSYISYCSLRDKNLFIEVKAENLELSTHLKEYEEILSQQQRNNHESKTELAGVRNLLKKDKSAGLKCLDMIIGNKEDLDETFYQRCQKMPSGIQGVVYQKLLLADPNIQIYIEVSPDIPKNDLENKLNSDIFLAGCKIIGVFLGNALEEVNEIENIDNKKISVQLYLEEKDTFVIQIGNTYRKNTDFSKLEEIGYTTKGKNHGQGLALVQDIEKKYFNLKHETIISGSMIFQKLKIKGLKL